MSDNDVTAEKETERFEVEVECLWTGTTLVEAEDGESALEIVESLDESEIIFNDMSPNDVETRGVYSVE